MSTPTFDLETSVARARLLFADGKTQDQIAEDLDLNFSETKKVFGAAKLKFPGAGGKGWREASAQAFIDNPELTEAEYIDLMKSIPDLKNPEVKGKYHYVLMAPIAKHFAAKIAELETES